MSDVRYRVEQGAKFLDERYGPEWIHRIDSYKLDLSSQTYCIIAQVNGSSYTRAMHHLGLSTQQSVDMGFTDASTSTSTYSWSHLTEAWRTYITVALSVQARQPEPEPTTKLYRLEATHQPSVPIYLELPDIPAYVKAHDIAEFTVKEYVP